jgi:hypothetical protein
MFSKGRMVTVHFEFKGNVHQTTIWTTTPELVSADNFGCMLRDFYAKLGGDVLSVNLIEMTEGSVNINQLSKEDLREKCGPAASGQAETCKLETPAMM